MHHLPLVPSAWFRPDLECQIFNKQTHLWERQQSQSCCLSCKWKMPMACKQRSAVTQFGTMSSRSVIQEKEMLLKQTFICPSVYTRAGTQPWTVSLFLATVGKLPNKNPPIPSPAAGQRNKKIQKQRTGREHQVCKMSLSRKLRFNTVTFVDLL